MIETDWVCEVEKILTEVGPYKIEIRYATKNETNF